MNGTKKPAPGGNRERAAGADFLAQQYFTAHPSSRQGLAALLPVGSVNAIPARELAATMGVEPRDISRSIERLRVSGVPVCANSQGYFLPDNAAELADYIRAFDRRLRSIRRTRLSLESALNGLSGQGCLWEDVL